MKKTILYLLIFCTHLLYSQTNNNQVKTERVKTKPVQVSFLIHDKEDRNPIRDFEILISSSSMSSTEKPDSNGYVKFVLPQLEDVYLIKIKSSGYVTMLFEVDTKNVDRAYGEMKFLSKWIELEKRQKGVDYSKYNTIADKAFLHENRYFDWKLDYDREKKEWDEVEVQEVTN